MRRSVETISKRLSEAEVRSRRGRDTVKISYTPASKGTAQLLTNIYLDNELSWSDAKPATDNEKIRWLKQYHPSKLADFRRTWEASTCARDHQALQELSRLLPMLDEP